MKLLRLESDNPKFRNIDFKDGLNIIAGIQLSPEDKKTFNGIGKSMSLNLVQYILGADISDKKIKEYLGTYGIFRLIFNHNEILYEIEKDFSKTGYKVNGTNKNKKQYGEFLTNLFLRPYKMYDDISFRQFFNCFARRYEGNTFYNDAICQQGMKKNDYNQRLVNFVLLNMDVDLVKECNNIKEELSKLEESSSLIKLYEKELDSKNIQDLKDRIEELKLNQENFVIAKNYSILKNDADILTEYLTEIRNNIYSLEKSLQIKKKNILEIDNLNIDVDLIESIYNEAKFFFNDNIKIRLEEAQSFHNNMVNNRQHRIKKEIKEINKEIELKKEELGKIALKRDSILYELDKKGALEEYNSIIENVKILENEINNLEKYKNISIDFKQKQAKLKAKEAGLKELSLEYIKGSEELIKENEKIFRKFVKRFYDNTGGNITLKDTKSAKYLYDLDVYIPKEGSQGIGGVKIFCYDMLLFNLNTNILDFLAHDGFILSGMDPRQVSTLIKIVLEELKNKKFQYFLNINQDTLDSILKIDILSEEEKKEINMSLILELNDTNPQNWLFGEIFG